MPNHIIRFVATIGFVLAMGSVANGQRIGWRIVKVYSNSDASTQFIEICGGFGTGGGDQPLAGQTLFASNGSTMHSFVFPSNLPGDSACFLVGTQGFADLKLVKPDYVVPNGFLFVPNGSVSLASFDTIKYAGLPTDGFHVINTDTDERSPNGDPTTPSGGVAVATNFAGQSYSFSVPGTIGPGFTGAWFDTAQSGHGLLIEVLPGNRFLAAWFAFNPTGTQQAWFTGLGTYSGNTATIAAVEQPTGGHWIPNFDPAQVVLNPWGTLTFTFSDCNHGKVDFNSTLGYGAGSMTLTRLTQPAGLSCP